MKPHKFTRKDIEKALPFILGITAFYIFFSWILSNVDLYFLKAYSASGANILLNLVGISAELQWLAEPTIFVSGIQAQINNLCAGDLEIALITAIILSTWDASVKKRAIGVIGAWLTILVLNPVRIFIVLASGTWFGWATGEFMHDFLFKLMLLVVIALYYYVWYVKYDKIKKVLSGLRKKYGRGQGGATP